MPFALHDVWNLKHFFFSSRMKKLNINFLVSNCHLHHSTPSRVFEIQTLKRWNFINSQSAPQMSLADKTRSLKANKSDSLTAKKQNWQMSRNVFIITLTMAENWSILNLADILFLTNEYLIMFLYALSWFFLRLTLWSHSRLLISRSVKKTKCCSTD